MELLSSQVRHEIKESGLSMYRLGKLSGVSQATLCHFKAGERGLRSACLDKIAATLGLKVTRTIKKFPKFSGPGRPKKKI
jgi:transcriptional regulator with XRE-family HTH domain